MEAAPPTYALAIQADHWDLIAPYLPFHDLRAAALVSRAWHLTFNAHLWGNPTSHYGIEDDDACAPLTRFLGTLRFARLQTRALTHTLQLPPAHTEAYEDPQAEWLRDCLDRLPNLQSLIVRGLSFFDQSALQALKFRPPVPTARSGAGAGSTLRANVIHGPLQTPVSSALPLQRALVSTHSFGLRLLDASNCSNVTPNSLASALAKFECLLYLDLSFTPASRDQGVLKSLRQLQWLQVLKVRGIRISDETMTTLAPSIAYRVRSLDLRDNEITDRGVRTLLDHAFIDESSQLLSGRRSPTLLRSLGSEMQQIYQGPGFEAYLRNAFTSAFVGRLAIEEAADGGVTHLYIANNKLTAQGVSSLIKTGRLHVLDVDTFESDVNRDASEATYPGSTERVDELDVADLTASLSAHACSTLAFLRINHTLVTGCDLGGTTDQNTVSRSEHRELPDLPTALTSPSAGELSSSSDVNFWAMSDELHGNAIYDHMRKLRVESYMQKAHNLHPAMLPRMNTLVLTNVPQTWFSDQISNSLLAFTTQCAEEARMAHQHASQDYSLPPGRLGHVAALRHSARGAFALERIVLELAPERHSSQIAKGGGWSPAKMRSVTADRDSEAFWSASETDFSFFDDHGPESARKTADSQAIRPKGQHASRKDSSLPQQSSLRGSSASSKFDTVAIISAFRKDRKAKHLQALASGAVDPVTEGYWDGIIQVVRPAVGETRCDEEQDYHSRRFWQA